MGYYIECPTPKGKADWLIKEHGAVEVEEPKYDPTKKQILICVIDNHGVFDAAGVAYSLRETFAFIRPNIGEQRPRRWLLLPKEKVIELCPFVKVAISKCD
jgi:hypothetical protein